MSESYEKCKFNCWMIGGAVGILGFLLMWLAGGFGVVSALFWGILLGVLVGFALSRFICGAQVSAAATAVAGAGAVAAAASRADSGAGSFEADRAEAPRSDVHEIREDSGAGSLGAEQSEADATPAEALREDSGAQRFGAASDAPRVSTREVKREDSGAGSFGAGMAEAVPADLQEERDDSGAGSLGAEQAEVTRDADPREDGGAQSFDDQPAPRVKSVESGRDDVREDSGAGSFASKNAGGADALRAELSAEDAAKTANADKPAEVKSEQGVDYDGDGVIEGENEGQRPEALSAPREGGADNLKAIKGVGPKLEGLLHELGFYHFDQVAKWSADEVAWVDANLKGFRGRVSRDNWVEQAKVLAEGGETEFSRKVSKGKVY